MRHRTLEELGYFVRDRGNSPVAAPLGQVTWPTVCAWPSGCDLPALEERAVCEQHAAELERRAEQLRRKEKNR